MAKIFHCADLHLDSPFSGQSAEKSLLLRRGVFDTFRRAVERAYAERCDLFLIAGDMFDSEFASPATLEAVMSLFESHGKMVFAVSPGNHDPYSQNSFWKRRKCRRMRIFFIGSPDKILNAVGRARSCPSTATLSRRQLLIAPLRRSDSEGSRHYKHRLRSCGHIQPARQKRIHHSRRNRKDRV